MKQVVLLFLFFVFVSGCSQSTAKHITALSQDDTKDAIVVDVRTPAEFSAGHLENALNINWFEPDFANQFQDIDKEKTIYVYCKVGGRSAKAQEKLKSLGYKNVINLEGGYDAVLAQEK